MKFKVAIDYDYTYTLNPQLFYNIAQLFADCNFDVHIVTFRSATAPIEHDTKLPVYYTDGIAKDRYMKSKGISIDVWIDDSPIDIVRDSKYLTE